MKKLADVEVKIVKMCESSGNEQFFVRLVRTDTADKSIFSQNLIEYACWQTKNLDKNECLSRAWFDASYLARFVGLESMDEVIIVNLDDSEKEILTNSLALFLKD